MDPLNDNIIALLQNSSDPFVGLLWKDLGMLLCNYLLKLCTAVAVLAGTARAIIMLFSTVFYLHEAKILKLLKSGLKTSKF